MDSRIKKVKNLAVVLNCDYSGLSIIQELGKHGIQCVAMDCFRSIGTFSKYAKFVRCPDSSKEELKFVDFLYDYCKMQALKPVLFPTGDNWAAAISKYKNRFLEVSFPCVGDWMAVNTVIDKKKFYKVGQEKRFLTPFTICNMRDIKDSHFPLVAKPRFRMSSSNQDNTELFKNMSRLRLTVFKDKEELNRFLKKERAFSEHLVFQKYIAGMSNKMYTVGIYANHEFEIMALFTGKKVRGYPADIGNCVVGENYAVPDYVIENTKKVVKELQLSGIAEFEYKKDSITNKFWLIEINPRSWTWIGISPACGVSIPMIAYRHLVGKKVEYTVSRRPDGEVKYIRLFQDVVNSVVRYNKDYPKWHKSLWQWILEIKKCKKVEYAEFNSGDWLIFLMGLYQIVKHGLGKKLMRIFGKKRSSNDNNAKKRM